MSEFINYRKITGIYKHPQADRLAIVKVDQFTVVHGKEEAEKLKVGQQVLHFPTDICIHPDKADELGVTNYCRHVQYKDLGKKQCRIVAARIRGVPSEGFIHTKTNLPKEVDFDEFFGCWRYEPPTPLVSVKGDIERWEHPDFPKYTKIKRMKLYPDAWTEGMKVRFTEKIHGMNTRLGVVKIHDEWRYMVGSHNCIVKEFSGEKRNTFWELLDEKVMNLLNFLCDGEDTVIIYGERFGAGVQDLDYGKEVPELRVFDIKVNGIYLDWSLVNFWCKEYDILTVPLLYEGSFSWSMLENLTNGGSIVANPSTYKSAFKGREGVVVTPLEETHSDLLNGRLIGKSISVDYEARRGGTEYH